ncbi:hypothetical protein [Ulvibacter litoralis]|uniref:Uncharacterized protein n=1 Tax=Ulvibacter litoralis TaxID=227084 RepID=A0A1G7HHH6_9FLAO|nr:hypothetical protein [Ulvibacter litoralis]GHC57843.1 hypothetical protein GCM10008083_23090 [Ulvibacter litoralis]SDE99940.1 hypothetical protein SAMN05421855_10499 [Ulvibacter litoralis]
MNNKATNELYQAIIKTDGINFRGVSIGDSLETVIEKEGNDFDNRGGTLPNYKYFFELGEMEELILVYAYYEETKAIYNLETTLKTYPKYYWEEAGGTDETEFYEKTKNNTLLQYVSHFTACKEKIIAHFEKELGAAEIDFKHVVYNKPYHNFSKHTWISGRFRLVLMSYLNDEKEPQGATTMELKLILTAT